MYRILSIDGGGIRGLVPALVLADLEARAGRPVADLFDLVAGTSTGAILGLSLLRLGADGRPVQSARELARAYQTEGVRVFTRSPWWRVRTLAGLLGPKYDAKHLERRLRERLGDTMLSEAACDVLVPSYDLEGRGPVFFKTVDIRAGKARDVPMRVAARCSSAAPTYFTPVHVEDRGWLADGGVVANNPAVCAYADARKFLGAGPEDVAVVSLGTGSLSTSLASRRVREGGVAAWARPLFDIVLDGQEDAADYQMRQMLPPDRYFRFQAALPDGADSLDDVSRGSFAALRASARRLVEERADDLATIAVTFAEQERQWL